MAKAKKTKTRCGPVRKIRVKFAECNDWTGSLIRITLRNGSLDGRFSSVGKTVAKLTYRTGEVYLRTSDRDHNGNPIFVLDRER